METQLNKEHTRETERLCCKLFKVHGHITRRQYSEHDHGRLAKFKIYYEDYIASLNNVLKVIEPLNYKKSTKHEGWILAMQKELEALEENETWEITTLPTNKRATYYK